MHLKPIRMFGVLALAFVCAESARAVAVSRRTTRIPISATGLTPYVGCGLSASGGANLAPVVSNEFQTELHALSFEIPQEALPTPLSVLTKIDLTASMGRASWMSPGSGQLRATLTSLQQDGTLMQEPLGEVVAPEPYPSCSEPSRDSRQSRFPDYRPR